MKRTLTLLGLLVTLVAGTAAAQTIAVQSSTRRIDFKRVMFFSFFRPPTGTRPSRTLRHS